MVLGIYSQPILIFFASYYYTSGTSYSIYVYKFTFRSFISFNIISNIISEATWHHNWLWYYHKTKFLKFSMRLETLHFWKLVTKQATTNDSTITIVLLLYAVKIYNFEASQICNITNLVPQTFFQGTTALKEFFKNGAPEVLWTHKNYIYLRYTT